MCSTLTQKLFQNIVLVMGYGRIYTISIFSFNRMSVLRVGGEEGREGCTITGNLSSLDLRIQCLPGQVSAAGTSLADITPHLRFFFPAPGTSILPSWFDLALF